MTAPISASAIDAYTPVARIGSGGQAEILLAVQRGTGGFEKLVVIKRLWPHLAGDEESRRRLEQEAQLVARLHHPNVCQVLNLIANEQGPLIVLEYLDGITLEHLTRSLPKERSRDDIRLIAAILQQASEGLHSAHTLRDRSGAPANLVHRDVSSGNLVITREGIVKVLDFGIAKASTSDHSRIASIRGTVPFMSPEQVRGEEIDRRSDVFSLAVLGYEAVTGLGLHRRSSLPETFDAIIEDEPPLIGEHQPALPPALERVLRHALAKSPNDRPGSAREFGVAVGDAVRELGGPLGLSDIAQFVEARFADHLSDRARQFESIRREAPIADHKISRWTKETFLGLPALDLSAVPASTMSLTPALRSTEVGHRRADPPSGSPTIIHAGVPPVSGGTGPASASAAAVVSGSRDEPSVAYPAPRRRGWLLAAGLVAIAVIVAVVIAQVPAGEPAPLTVAHTSAPEGTPARAEAMPLAVDAAVTTDDAEIAIGPDAAAAREPERVANGEAIEAAPPTSPTSPKRPARTRPSSTSSKRPRPTAPESADPVPAPGFLTVDSRPTASITIDGRALGQVPLYRVQLAPGSYRMVAKLEDGRTKTIPIQIRSGEDVRKRLTW